MLREEIEVREDSDNYFSFELEEEMVELEEVVVTAEAKRLIPEERTPAFVTVIRREDFEGKFSSLPDLLSKSLRGSGELFGGIGELQHGFDKGLLVGAGKYLSGRHLIEPGPRRRCGHWGIATF